MSSLQSSTASTARLTVGFDLDMTLLDTRPGIKATLDALSSATGAYIDSDLAVTRLGPPLQTELENWFSGSEISEALALFRLLYPDHAVTASSPLPGALDAVREVRRHGGRVVVVTGKYKPNAWLHLDHVGLRPDLLIGELWAEEKGKALLEQDASIYVGDHVADMVGAKTANACAVGVATGPCDMAELLAADADAVLADLTEFPAWFDDYLAIHTVCPA